MELDTPAPAPAPVSVPAPAALPTSPSPAVQAMRKNFKMAAISQFVNLFKHHIALDFSIEDLELDLDGTKPGCAVPQLLGKLLNTLANDRNVNSTNWMNALRRAFTRRYDGENPFYSLISVPIEPPAQRGRPSKALIAARLEDALYKAQLEAAEAEALANPSPKKEDTKPELETTVASTSTIPERVPADSTPAPETAGTLAAVPAEEDASPVKMDLDVDSKSDIKEEGSATPGPGMPVKPVRPTHQMAQKEIEWEDIALETKIDAIYQICEWHMSEPDRFRKHLKWEDDLGWRLEPSGYDADGNAYFVLTDTRLWIQRTLPPSAERIAATAAAARAERIKAKRQQYRHVEHEIIPKKRSSSGRAPPKQRGGGGSDVRKGKKRDHDSDGDDDDDDDGSDYGGGNSRPKRSKDARGGRKKVKGVAAKAREEGWEEVPEEWMEKEEEMDDEDDEDYDRHARSPGGSSVVSSAPEEEEGDFGDEDEGEEVEAEVQEVDEEGKTAWEREYWTERETIEAEGFVEWEAICVTLEEWKAFPTRFDKTKDKDEKKFRDYLRSEVLPWVIEEHRLQAQKAIDDIEAAANERTTAIAVLEIEQEDEVRAIAERSEMSSRLSRASRHQVTALNPDGSPAPLSVSNGKYSVLPESRDERIKKRADEKRARETATVVAQVENAESQARDEANGVAVPEPKAVAEEEEDAEDLEELKREEEERAQKKEDARVRREQQAAVRAAERAAEKLAEKLEKEKLSKEKPKEQVKAVKAEKPKEAKAGKPKPVYYEEEEEEEEEPWYLDCEVCGVQGWNQDDGSEIISCDQCQDWQHLGCHVQANLDAGRPAVDYDNVDFICARCKLDPTRDPTRSKQTRAPAAAAISVEQEEDYVPGEEDQPVRATPTPKATASRSTAPRYAPAVVPAARAAPAAAAAAPAAPGAAAPIAYDDLLAMVTQNPGMLAQLPRNYQEHFAGLLGLPLPSV